MQPTLTPPGTPTPPSTETPQVTSSDPQLLDPTHITLDDSGEGTQGDGGQQHSGWRDFLGFVGILAIAGMLALFLITFVFRSYAVDGPSMESTLQHQDKLIIWKIPRTLAKITGKQYVPNRGDVIIFSESNLGACGQEGEREIIKRVIGLPGERVIVSNNVITVYNAEQPGGFQPDKTLPYNKDNRIPETTGDTDITLHDNQIFVSGDNRPNSCDSRAFGPIQTNQIIGKLVLRLLPANNITVF